MEFVWPQGRPPYLFLVSRVLEPESQTTELSGNATGSARVQTRASRWLIVPVLTRWQGKRTIPVQPNDRKWCTWSLCDHEDNQISVSLIGPGCREDSSARCRCPKPTTPAKPVPGKMADRALLTRWYGDRKIPVQMIVDEWSDSSVKGHCYFSKGGPDLPIRLLVRGTATFLFRKIHEHCTAITRLIFNIFPSELRIELILNICNEWQSARTQLFVFPDQR